MKGGITGISWGGYTTCTVASLDSRFRAAVPVYGCGHLRDNSCWLGDFERIGPGRSSRWADLYDSARYLPACRVPSLLLADLAGVGEHVAGRIIRHHEHVPDAVADGVGLRVA